MDAVANLAVKEQLEAKMPGRSTSPSCYPEGGHDHAALPLPQSLRDVARADVQWWPVERDRERHEDQEYARTPGEGQPARLPRSRVLQSFYERGSSQGRNFDRRELLGCVGLLVRLCKGENHPRDSRAQGLHIASLLDPPLQGSLSPVAGYGPGNYGRLPKDLGRTVRCWLVVCAPHVATPLLRLWRSPLDLLYR